MPLSFAHDRMKLFKEIPCADEIGDGLLDRLDDHAPPMSRSTAKIRSSLHGI